MKTQLHVQLPLLVSFFFLVSCSVVPMTGRKQVTAIPSSQMIALSEALKTQNQRTMELAMLAFGVGSQVGVMLPYSRTHESEADELGLYFMAMAGYDPQTAPQFWERMDQGAEARPPEFLSTHPHPHNRIAHLKQIMPKALEYYHAR